jgi:DNA-binding transcriptional LysR family regulator
MRLDQITAFIRCAEAGSLSAAARAERMPKSTVSRLLAELELDIGARLFDRSSKGLKLTDEGRAMLSHGRGILSSVETARAAIRPAPNRLSGVVRLTAPYTFGMTFLAPHLSAFFAKHPLVHVQMDLSSRNIDLLEEGYDVAVRIGNPPPGMVAHVLSANPLKLCASPAYLKRSGTPKSPTELEKHPLLVIGRPRSKAALRLVHHGGSHFVEAMPRLVSSDPALVLKATLDGCGIGQIPEIIGREPLERRQIVEVLPLWKMTTEDIFIISPRDRASVPRVSTFVEFLTKALRSQLAGQRD